MPLDALSSPNSFPPITSDQIIPLYVELLLRRAAIDGQLPRVLVYPPLNVSARPSSFQDPGMYDLILVRPEKPRLRFGAVSWPRRQAVWVLPIASNGAPKTTQDLLKTLREAGMSSAYGLFCRAPAKISAMKVRP
ncbi:hypothetical protein IAU59_007585 [Kwoniella sp. CBS 9459]